MRSVIGSASPISDLMAASASCYSNTINWNPTDDTVLMSFPGPNTVVQINRQTGTVVATYGDFAGSYAFSPTTWSFEYQHFPNITAAGTLLVSTHLSMFPNGSAAGPMHHAFAEFEIDRTSGRVVASVTSAVNGRGNQTVQISTTVPTRLVAFVSADGPQNVGAGGQASTLSGGGLSWTLVARANQQFGDAEIWTADAPAALAGAAITSTLLRHRTGSDYIHLVRLVAFTGVSGVGASNVASGQTVAVASVSLNAQAAGSVIYAVGQDWTNGVTRTFPAGQVQDVQMVGADLDTFWVQRTAVPIAAAGAITFTATSATQAAAAMRISAVRARASTAITSSTSGATFRTSQSDDNP